MREAQTREICGRRYEVRPLPGKLALRLATRFAKMIGPIVMGAVGANVAGEATPAAVLSFLSKLNLGEMLAGLRDTDIEELSVALAEFTKMDKTPGQDTLVPLAAHFDNHFRDYLNEWMDWFVFAIEVSFGPFVDGLKARLAAVKSSSVAAPANT